MLYVVCGYVPGIDNDQAHEIEAASAAEAEQEFSRLLMSALEEDQGDDVDGEVFVTEVFGPYRRED